MLSFSGVLGASAATRGSTISREIEGDHRSGGGTYTHIFMAATGTRYRVIIQVDLSYAFQSRAKIETWLPEKCGWSIVGTVPAEQTTQLIRAAGAQANWMRGHTTLRAQHFAAVEAKLRQIAKGVLGA